MTADPKGLGALFDAHTDAEFRTRDIEATMATMSASPHVTHVPTMTGGSGREAVRRFYDTWFIGHWPEDTVVTPISRTVGETQVVDEVMISFTHDCEMPALLPGVKPTGRKVTIPFVVVVGFKDRRIEFERIYWDQASMLAQLGLIDSAKLPVSGAEQAARLIDPSLPPIRSFPRAETQLPRLGLLLRGVPGLRFCAGCGSDFDFVTCLVACAS
jgi:carboxymethylenebutenolidase